MGVTGPEEFGDPDSWVWCHMLHPGFGKSHGFLVVHYPSASQVGSRSCHWSFFPPWLDLFLGRLSLWKLTVPGVHRAGSPAALVPGSSVSPPLAGSCHRALLSTGGEAEPLLVGAGRGLGGTGCLLG